MSAHKVFSFVLCVCLIISTMPAKPISEDTHKLKHSDHEDLQDNISEKEIVELILLEYYQKFVIPYLELSAYLEVSEEDKQNGESKYSSYFDKLEQLENDTRIQSDMAQSDFVVSIDNNSMKIMLPIINKTQDFNLTEISALLNNNKKSSSNNTYDMHKLRERARKDWLDVLKNNVLQRTGRKNDSHSLSPEILDQVRISLNKTSALPFFRTHHSGGNRTGTDLDDYTEKMRSFYPSCDVPRNTDEDAWKDVNTMNLFFTVDYNPQSNEDAVNIATATLRLYKLPQEFNHTNHTVQDNCQKGDNQHINDEDKQIRVSVYWYSRSLKKHKAIKRRLSDSKMVPLQDYQNSYVEFNIRSATKSWVRGRNLGLGIVVEDIEGSVLPADKYFRGIGCSTVGNVSTPKPIPTMVIDAIRGSNGYKSVPNASVPATDDNNYFMPIVDICTVELPHNSSQLSDFQMRGITCKYLRDNSKSRKMFGAMRYERIGTMSDILASSGRHIRHQRQHHSMGKSESTNRNSFDFRNRIVSKRIVFTNKEIASINSQIRNSSNIQR